MPLYEYKCKQCKRHTEKIQKFSDAEITTCPHCGGKLERVISAPAIAFKGGGWYADGYGNAKPSNPTSEAGNGSENQSSSSIDASASSSEASAPGKTDTAVKSDAPAKSPTNPTKAPSSASHAAATSSSTDKK